MGALEACSATCVDRDVSTAAMVTESSGPVQRTGANAGPVGMLQDLPSGARVSLAAGAKLVVVFSATASAPAHRRCRVTAGTVPNACTKWLVAVRPVNARIAS